MKHSISLSKNKYEWLINQLKSVYGIQKNENS